MNVGISIRRIRKTKFPDLNQTKFANLIGITQTYLSQIETGNKTPTINVLESISEKLEIPLPIIFWFGIEAKDISEEKKDSFILLKPTIDSMINNLF